MNAYVADFETTTDPLDCRVWGWGLYSLKKDKTLVGGSIKDFMKALLKLPSSSNVYFHNLKFDGEFIFYYLKENGFKWSGDYELNHKEFSTLITDTGVFYSIRLQYKNKTINILDSLKILPLPVNKISKAFNIDQLKGEIDYNKYRPPGYKLTDNEKAYIINDVEIVGKALNYFFDQGLNKMTQASNAFSDFKSLYKDTFRKIFPELQNDKELRKSYKGGWTYVNPKYQGKDIKKGIVFDVNSLYPSVMYYSMLPYGEPIYYKGGYQKDTIYSLYIQNFSCVFKLKKDHVPTIQLKTTLGFMPTEYATSSNGLEINLTLTSVDLELFLKHYEVDYIDFHYGWKFKASNQYFKAYIDKWVTIKNQATIDGNEGLRTIAKLMLNALYGKYALNPIVKSKKPVWSGDLVKYETLEEQERESVYVPMASFITAYARKITIDAAQENYPRFIYADTDSIHLTGYEVPNIDVDPVKLGAWKKEYNFIRGRFLRAKAYIEELEDHTTHIACSGLPHRCHSYINFDNFKDGLKVPSHFFIDGVMHPGKLQHKRVKGGVVLEEKEYNLKL